MTALYELRHTATFDRDLNKLDSSIKKHLEKTLEKVLEDPARFKPLEHFPSHYRLRLEQFRVIYKVEGNAIILLFVRKRDEVYRQIK